MTDGSSTRKRRYLRYTFTVFLVLFLVWGGAKACTRITGVIYQPPYRIAQERITNNVYVMGKERDIEAFEGEIMRAAASYMDIRIQLQSVTPDLGFAGMDRGLYDALITLTVPDAANMKYYVFSDPIYRLGAVLIVRTGSDVTSLSEMSGKIIGIPRETSTFFDVGVYPNLLFYSYDSENNALQDLDQNKIDGVVMNAWIAYVLTLGRFSGRLKVATPPFTKEGLRLVAPIDSVFAEEIPAFNKALEEIRQNGTYHDFLHKWGLIDTDDGRS